VLVTGLIAVIERRTSEFAVTNKRVLITTGLIRRHSEKAPELLAEPPKIEKTDVLADRLPG
jgi:hypothetical protein